MRPVAVESPLVDIADEEVGAARVAELADLPQQLLDLGSRALLPAVCAGGRGRGRPV